MRAKQSGSVLAARVQRARNKAAIIAPANIENVIKVSGTKNCNACRLFPGFPVNVTLK